MDTIPEDEIGAEATAVAKADPEFPPFLYVESSNPKEKGVYFRSFKITTKVFVPYLKPIPSYIKPLIAMDPTGVPERAPSFAFPPLFYYSASKPLPPDFRIPYSDRPSEFYVSLTHIASLVNITHSPPRVKSNTATQKVLRTPELLESIFLNLDMLHVLTIVQRVNKTWKRVVDESLALQRKLYFKPEEEGEVETVMHPQSLGTEDDRTVFPVFNRLLVRHFSSSFFNFGPVYGWQRRAEAFYENRWTPHHLKLKRAKTFSSLGKVYKPVGHRLGGLATLQAAQDRERFTRAGASWRKMLVCQPPISDFGAMIFQPLRDTPLPQKMEKAIIKAHNPDIGLCMGQLYDFVQERAGNHPLPSLWFRLTWFEAYGPYTSELCRDTADELFLKTELVVEMFHKRDHCTAYNPRDPPEPEVFDSVFKCEEFKPHRWVPDAIAVDYKSQGYNSTSPLVDANRSMVWCGFVHA